MQNSNDFLRSKIFLWRIRNRRWQGRPLSIFRFFGGGCFVCGKGAEGSGLGWVGVTLFSSPFPVFRPALAFGPGESTERGMEEGKESTVEEGVTNDSLRPPPPPWNGRTHHQHPPPPPYERRAPHVQADPPGVGKRKEEKGGEKVWEGGTFSLVPLPPPTKIARREEKRPDEDEEKEEAEKNWGQFCVPLSPPPVLPVPLLRAEKSVPSGIQGRKKLPKKKTPLFLRGRKGTWQVEKLEAVSLKAMGSLKASGRGQSLDTWNTTLLIRLVHPDTFQRTLSSAAVY